MENFFKKNLFLNLTPKPMIFQYTAISSGACKVWNIFGFSKQTYFHLHSFIRLKTSLEVKTSWVWTGREERNWEKSEQWQRKGVSFPSPIFKWFLFLAFFFRAAPMACGNSQARGWIRAAAASLCHSNSNMGPKLHLWPVPQLTATPDP